MKQTFVMLLTAAGLALSAGSAAGAVFAEYTAFDINAETATGTLNGVSFTLECTAAAFRPGVPDNGGVVSATTNNSSAVFDSASVFTPSLPFGDEIALGAASDFRIIFAQPVSNITLHLSQLQANRLSFTTGGVAVAFALLSSDGDLTSSSGDTAIQGGPGGGDDASGSLFFAGVFTELSWTSEPGTNTTTSTPDDGFRLQLSVAPEIPPQLKIIMVGDQQAELAWSTNHVGYELESALALPAANWDPVTNTVVIVGPDFSVVAEPGETQRFFRLRKD